MARRKQQVSPPYQPDQWVMVSYGERGTAVKRYRQVSSSWLSHIERAATPDEVAEAERQEQAQREAQAARMAREAEQDWQDANFIMSALEHDRESAMRKLGAARLREWAQLLGGE